MQVDDEIIVEVEPYYTEVTYVSEESVSVSETETETQTSIIRESENLVLGLDETSISTSEQEISHIGISQIGTQGPPGIAGSGEKFVYIQNTPSTEWVVNHNMGLYPLVEVRTVGGAVIDADVVHITQNQFRVYFSFDVAGQVVCI